MAVHSGQLAQAHSQLAGARSGLAAAQAEQRRLADQLADLTRQRADAAREVQDARHEVAVATAGLKTARHRLALRRSERAAAQVEVTRARARLRVLAVAAYVDGREPPLVSLVSDSRQLNTQGKKQVLFDAVGGHRIAQIHARINELRQAQHRVHLAIDRVNEAEDALGRAIDRLTAGIRHRDAVDGEIADTQNQSRDAAATTVRRLTELQVAQRVVADARVLAAVDGVDFPLVALDAYWRAAHTAPCRLEWWGLAGIARVESGHGTAQGSSLDATGQTTKAIIGIALNGQGAAGLVRDSDGGRLDHDPVFDRAVGPMQFIPSTWARWAADGNGDGRSDPQNIYDVALAAARYLCFGRGDLTNDAGLRSGYFSYNQSAAYVESVLRYARHYQSSVVIPAVR